MTTEFLDSLKAKLIGPEVVALIEEVERLKKLEAAAAKTSAGAVHPWWCKFDAGNQCGCGLTDLRTAVRGK